MADDFLDGILGPTDDAPTGTVDGRPKPVFVRFERFSQDSPEYELFNEQYGGGQVIEDVVFDDRETGGGIHWGSADKRPLTLEEMEAHYGTRSNKV
jgi:hypothetical protein